LTFITTEALSQVAAINGPSISWIKFVGSDRFQDRSVT
jgi:hypothetical protein